MPSIGGSAALGHGSLRSIVLLVAMGASSHASAQEQPPGRPGWPCAGRPDPAYVKTSEATGGQLFMFHPSEVGDSGALMAASFTHKATLFRVAGPLDEGLHEYVVTVDGSVESALFSVSIQCLQVVEIERPTGALVQASDEGADYHQFEAGRIVTIARPEPGSWKVRASGRGLSFIVVQARTPLSLGEVQLLAQKGGNADESPVFQPGRAGTRQAVAIDVNGEARDIQARLVSAQFETLGPIPLVASENQSAGPSWRGAFVVPSVPFRIVVSGTGPDARPFVRVHAPLFEPAR